ncbi:thiopeptide-type bacteriocin biosynthesis protein [Actinoplanes sp. NPDC048796]|uniref:thiopeptide-type bacteriocin biosynthesis protein n=1 Tax=Actinoplanes sp. NPDC048796 TaxID=3155640 RepID=UPI0033C3CA17
MNTSPWQQASLQFPDPALAEQIAGTHLWPILTEAEADQLINAWFIIRKGHQWRLRYLPTLPRDIHTNQVRDRLDDLRLQGHLANVTAVIYEPETTAFGGPRAMRLAHRLWHLDSRHLLPRTATQPRRTRELSILLCTAMMRAAGLDWYEQGDVWARVADHRNLADPSHLDALRDAVQQLLTVDPASLTHTGEAPLAEQRTWLDAFTTTGAALRRIHDSGQLRRGLRDVLTHHVIFMWNRRGIPEHEQAALAATARDITFGSHTALTATAAG